MNRRAFLKMLPFAPVMATLPCGLKELPASDGGWAVEWSEDRMGDWLITVRHGEIVFVQGRLYCHDTLEDFKGFPHSYNFRVGSLWVELGSIPLENAKKLAGYKMAEWMQQAKNAFDTFAYAQNTN